MSFGSDLSKMALRSINERGVDCLVAFCSMEDISFHVY